uniref:Uncharacterized protein n=1 Tax=Octopus bimaculoides TaxID=37653 RepID=A0A0L8FWM3_OCTBM
MWGCSVMCHSMPSLQSNSGMLVDNVRWWAIRGQQDFRNGILKQTITFNFRFVVLPTSVMSCVSHS